MNSLEGHKIAILATDGFEQSELYEPHKKLKELGAEVEIISVEEKKEIRSWKDGEWDSSIKVDRDLASVQAEDYDALILPGGTLNPDRLRRDKKAVEFAKHFLESGKPLAAICHGPQLLIETKLIKGRTMTSFSSIRTDLENAGVTWVDEEVHVDRGIVTSRSPKDLPAFIDKTAEEVAEGKHRREVQRKIG